MHTFTNQSWASPCSSSAHNIFDNIYIFRTMITSDSCGQSTVLNCFDEKWVYSNSFVVCTAWQKSWDSTEAFHTATDDKTPLHKFVISIKVPQIKWTGPLYIRHFITLQLHAATARGSIVTCHLGRNIPLAPRHPTNIFDPLLGFALLVSLTMSSTDYPVFLSIKHVLRGHAPAFVVL